MIEINHNLENIELNFEDGLLIKCDYLILSDGIFSKTKSLITNKEIKPKYFNSIAVRATINQCNLKKIDHNNISLFLGSNLHSIVYPVNKNGEFNFVSILRKSLNNSQLADYSLFDTKDFVSSTLMEISKQVDPDITQNLKDIKCFPIYVSSEIFQPQNKKYFSYRRCFFCFPTNFCSGCITINRSCLRAVQKS